MSGVTVQQLGPLSYLVEISAGKFWKRHVDHVKDYPSKGLSSVGHRHVFVNALNAGKRLIIELKVPAVIQCEYLCLYRNWFVLNRLRMRLRFIGTKISLHYCVPLEAL